MTIKTMLAAATLATATATGAQAATVVRNVTVENHSFEALPQIDGQFCRGCVPGWTAGAYPVPAGRTGNGSGQQNPASSVMPTMSDGPNVGYVDTFVADGAPSQGSLSQATTETIAAGTTYSLSVDVGRRLDVPAMPIWYAELFRVDATTFADLGTLAQATLGAADVAAGTFAPLTFGYTGTAAAAGSLLGIRFRSVYNPDQGSAYRGVLLDNVRLTATAESIATVPEPAAWAMLIGGFGMVGGTMRRRRATIAFA